MLKEVFAKILLKMGVAVENVGMGPRPGVFRPHGDPELVEPVQKGGPGRGEESGRGFGDRVIRCEFGD